MNDVRPLTHRGADGQVYHRRPEVEQQIAATEALPVTLLLERIRIRARTDPAYLKDECLVYLLRAARRAGAPALVNDLAEELVHRCHGIVYVCVGGLGADTEDASAEVLQQVFNKLTDLSSDRGDYFEVSFGNAVKRLAVSAFRRYSQQQNQGTGNVSWDDLAGHEAALAGDSSDLPEDTLVRNEARAAARAALHALGEPYGTAYRLRYDHGWPVHDADPHHPSLSRYFNVDPRTIRNWFRRAEQRLAQFREGQA